MEHWRQNLYGLWSAQFVASVGLNLVIPFLPLYLRELGVQEDAALRLWSGVIVAAPFLISAGLQPLWGALGDRRGRKPMVVRAMLGLALTNALQGFAETATQLLILRLLQGTLAGFMAPSTALLVSCAPREKTGTALAALQTAFVAGFVVGPLVGGILASSLGYRAIFFSTGALCLFGGLLVWRFVREDFTPSPTARIVNPLHHIRRVWATPSLRTLLLTLTLLHGFTQLAVPFLTLYVETLNTPRAYLELLSGLVFGITGLTMIFASPYWGRRSDRCGHASTLRLTLAGVTLFLLPQAFVADTWQLVVLRAGLGLFIAGTVPAINAMVQRHTSDADRGGIYGIFQSGFLLGHVVGPVAGGTLAAVIGFRPIFVLSAAGLALVFFLVRREPSLDRSGG